MPSWLILSLIIAVFFIAAWLLAERLSLGLTRQRKSRDRRIEARVPKEDGRPDGW